MTTRWFEDAGWTTARDRDGDLWVLTRCGWRPRQQLSAAPLHVLRQAYLDAGDGDTAAEALLGFLAAVAAAKTEAELDGPPADDRRPGAGVAADAARVAYAFVAAFGCGMLAAVLTGSGLATCVVVFAVVWASRVLPARQRHRR